MKHKQIRSPLGALAVGTLLTGHIGTAVAVPMAFTDRTAWEAAIKVIDPAAVIRLEDFNDETVTPDGPLGGPGTAGYGLDAGPHHYGQTSGEVSLTLNDIGNGGSQTGIVASGNHDGSNALEMLVSEDTSDTTFGPIVVLGVGVESADVAFSPGVYGFGGSFWSWGSNNGVKIDVNGVPVSLPDFPFQPGDLEDIFFGIVDSDGIAGFSLVPDNRDANAIFEGFQLDDLEYAYAGRTPPPPGGMPEPATVGLLLAGITGVGLVRRRRGAGIATQERR